MKKIWEKFRKNLTKLSNIAHMIQSHCDKTAKMALKRILGCYCNLDAAHISLMNAEAEEKFAWFNFKLCEMKDAKG